MQNKLKFILELIRFKKPIGFLLLLWPTLSALFVNLYNIPSIKNIIVFFIGAFLTRSIGCAINDLCDINIDKHVERTKNRPISSGKLSIKDVLSVIFIIILLLLFLVLQLSLNSILFSPFVLLTISIYPLCKRFFSVPQIVLGFAFSLSILLIYISEKTILDNIAICLFLSTIIWAIIYDTQYALVDMDDDLKIEINSSAIFFGQYSKYVILILQFFHISAYLYIFFKQKICIQLLLFFIISFSLIVYQKKLMEIGKQGSFLAFLNNNYYGFFINIPLIFHFLI